MKFHHQFEIHGRVIGMKTHSCQLTIATDAETIHPLSRWPTLKRSLNQKSKKFVIECSWDWLSNVNVKFPYASLKFFLKILVKNWLWCEQPQKRKEDVVALGRLNTCGVNTKTVVYCDTIRQQQVDHPFQEGIKWNFLHFFHNNKTNMGRTDDQRWRKKFQIVFVELTVFLHCSGQGLDQYPGDDAGVTQQLPLWLMIAKSWNNTIKACYTMISVWSSNAAWQPWDP